MHEVINAKSNLLYYKNICHNNRKKYRKERHRLSILLRENIPQYEGYNLIYERIANTPLIQFVDLLPLSLKIYKGESERWDKIYYFYPLFEKVDFIKIRDTTGEELIRPVRIIE